MLKAAAAALVIAAGLARTATAGPLEDGLVAAQHGDYAAAARLWGPLAEQGNPEAQYNLGIAYQYGHGVTRTMLLQRAGFERRQIRGSPPLN